MPIPQDGRLPPVERFFVVDCPVPPQTAIEQQLAADAGTGPQADNPETTPVSKEQVSAQPPKHAAQKIGEIGTTHLVEHAGQPAAVQAVEITDAQADNMQGASEPSGVEHQQTPPKPGDILAEGEGERLKVQETIRRGISVGRGYSEITGDPAENRTKGLTPEIFEQLYDPSKPTIAFDINEFGGAELFGQAAQPDQEERKANVIFISSAMPFGEFATREDGGSNLLIQSGVIAAPDGTFFAGAFPQEVSVDTLQTMDPDLYKQSQGHGIPSMCGEPSEGGADKSPEQRPYLQGLLPERIEPNAMWRDDPEASYVVKPLDRYGGIGVADFTPENATDAHDYIDFLKEHDYEPIVEKKIECLRLQDPETNQQLHWKARTIISNGEVIGGYIRAGNNTIVGGRNQLIPFDKLDNYLSEAQAAQVRTKLQETAEYAAARLPDGYWGLDHVVDQDMQEWVFETNGNNVGGLQTIATAEPGSLNLKPISAVLDNWVARTPIQPKDGAYVARTSTIPGVLATLCLAPALRRTAKLSHIDINDIGGQHAQPEVIQEWLHNQHTAAKQEGPAKVAEVEAMHRARFPLDIPEKLPHWIANSPDPAAYAPLLDKLSTWMPHNLRIKNAQHILAQRLADA